MSQSSSLSLPQALLTLLLPFSISLCIYLTFTYLVIPLWQSQSSNLPLDSMSEFAGRAKRRVFSWLWKVMGRREEGWDEDAGEEDEETGMLNYEEDRGRLWRG